MRRAPLSPTRRAYTGLWAALGLLLGLGAGLLLAWVVWPVQYTDTTPSDLMAERKALWAELAADGYALTGDLQSARSRLALLGLADPGAFVAQVAEARIEEGASLQHIRAMARLSEDLGGITARLLVYIATPAPTPSRTTVMTATPTPMPAASLTATPLPAPTATPTTPASAQVYRLSGKERVCMAGARPDMIAVYVHDAIGRGIAGIRIEVAWAGGADAFYTGLKPYVDPGYADFDMEPGTEYAVTVGTEGSDIARGIAASDDLCAEIDGPYHHEWVLRFRRVRP
jgi:hypothetical protein